MEMDQQNSGQNVGRSRFNEKQLRVPKTAQATFKSITRNHRNNLPDGKSIQASEQRPSVGHYHNNYRLVEKSLPVPKFRQETKEEIERDNLILPADTSICGRLL